jgi:predicted house-cleaning noncanonical NTP pyrophosphatase (MazG superfamily)
VTLPAQGKLVRDRIPEIIAKDGRRPVVEHVDPDDLLAALRLKVLEEASELAEAHDQQIVEEVADVLEVLMALSELIGVAWSDVNEKRLEKRSQRGGFENGIWLSGVESGT